MTWLRRCLGREDLAVGGVRRLAGRSGCDLAVCQVEGDAVVLKRYVPGFVDSSGLGPVRTARKHTLALQELPAFGVPTPHLLGFAACDEEAALVMEWVPSEPLTPAGRLEAARVLARLHAIPFTHLSRELADLAARSTQNRGRLGEVPEEPPLRETTLQHGDYFSVNFAATGEAVRVLDWDDLACGDPMWDLAFLMNVEDHPAERAAIDAEAITHAYRQVRPFDSARLAWHPACFDAFWRKRA